MQLDRRKEENLKAQLGADYKKDHALHANSLVFDHFQIAEKFYGNIHRIFALDI